MIKKMKKKVIFKQVREKLLNYLAYDPDNIIEERDISLSSRLKKIGFFRVYYVDDFIISLMWYYKIKEPLGAFNGNSRIKDIVNRIYELKYA